MSTTDPLLERIKPIIYIPREPQSLQNVLYEKFDNYYVLWFHWPSDGIISLDSLGLTHEDYEPIILVVKDEKLVAIGIRPGNKYEYSLRWSLEDNRPVIVFWTPWHHPIIFNGEGILESMKKVGSERRSEYAVTVGKPPDWFLNADSGKSVYDYADEVRSRVSI